LPEPPVLVAPAFNIFHKVVPAPAPAGGVERMCQYGKKTRNILNCITKQRVLKVDQSQTVDLEVEPPLEPELVTRAAWSQSRINS